MRMFSRVVVIGAAATLLLGCASAPPARDPGYCPGLTTSGPDVEEIRRLELRGAAANVEGWTLEEARAFFAPEWVSVQPDGSRIGLDQVFAGFIDGRSQPGAESFVLPELDIRVYCDTAVVFGLAEARARGVSADAAPIRFRYANFWRKDAQGRWLYAGQLYHRP